IRITNDWKLLQFSGGLLLEVICYPVFLFLTQWKSSETITKVKQVTEMQRRESNIRNFSDEEIDDMYLDYVNNFVTISKFAAYYGITEKLARSIIKQARS